MGYWWLDRVLPGFVAGLPVFSAGLFVQFRYLRRNLNRVTDSQTSAIKAHLDRKDEAG